MSSSASSWPTTTLRTSPATRACSSFTSDPPCRRFGAHERGGERVDVLHARGRQRVSRVLGRAEAAAGRPDRDDRRQRQPEQRPLHAARAARRSRARRRSRGRSPGTRPGAARRPARGRAPRCRPRRGRGCCSGEASASSATLPRPPRAVTTSGASARADHRQRAAELVPAAAVDVAHLRDAGGLCDRHERAPRSSVAVGLPARAARRAPRRARTRRPRRPRRAARRRSPSRRSPAPPRARATCGSSTTSVSPARGGSSATACAAAAPDARSARAPPRTRRGPAGEVAYEEDCGPFGCGASRSTTASTITKRHAAPPSDAAARPGRARLTRVLDHLRPARRGPPRRPRRRRRGRRRRRRRRSRRARRSRPSAARGGPRGSRSRGGSRSRPRASSRSRPARKRSRSAASRSPARSASSAWRSSARGSAARAALRAALRALGGADPAGERRAARRTTRPRRAAPRARSTTTPRPPGQQVVEPVEATATQVAEPLDQAAERPGHVGLVEAVLGEDLARRPRAGRAAARTPPATLPRSCASRASSVVAASAAQRAGDVDGAPVDGVDLAQLPRAPHGSSTGLARRASGTRPPRPRARAAPAQSHREREQQHDARGAGAVHDCPRPRGRGGFQSRRLPCPRLPRASLVGAAAGVVHGGGASSASGELGARSAGSGAVGGAADRRAAARSAAPRSAARVAAPSARRRRRPRRRRLAGGSSSRAAVAHGGGGAPDPPAGGVHWLGPHCCRGAGAAGPAAGCRPGRRRPGRRRGALLGRDGVAAATQRRGIGAFGSRSKPRPSASSWMSRPSLRTRWSKYRIVSSAARYGYGDRGETSSRRPGRSRWRWRCRRATTRRSPTGPAG